MQVHCFIMNNIIPMKVEVKGFYMHSKIIFKCMKKELINYFKMCITLKLIRLEYDDIAVTSLDLYI